VRIKAGAFFRQWPQTFPSDVGSAQLGQAGML
jgi:hypothetical protein